MITTSPQPKFLTRRQIEQLYGISSKWLANLATKKKGPIYRKLGKKVIYPVPDFERWLERNSVEIKTEESAGSSEGL